MKPDPYRVRAAVGILDADNHECALIGDTTADVFAGLLAAVPVIGYANKPARPSSSRRFRQPPLPTTSARL